MVKKLKLVEFPIWKTIKLGTGLKTSDDFSRALHSQHCIVGTETGFMMDSMTSKLVIRATEVKLVAPSVSELGFSSPVRSWLVHQRGREFGLEFCPPEVGPQLRLQYLDQPQDEHLIVVMDTIFGNVFVVGHGSTSRDHFLYLGHQRGEPDCQHRTHQRFVFVSRKAD